MGPFGSIGKIVFGLLLLVGLPFACVGAYEIVETRQFINASGQALGTVVDNTYIVTNDGGTESGAYYPVVEFVAGEETVRFQDGAGSLPPDYAVGARVEVLYDPSEPHTARLRSWKRLWLAPSIFIAAGLLPVSVFAVVWWAVLGRAKNPRRPATDDRRQPVV